MARPRQPGLTENELEVMRVLWKESPLRVADVLERVKRNPKPAYTSLLTLVQIMEKKGYVKSEKDGKAFAYSPVLQEKRFLSSEIKRMAKRLIDGSPGDLVLNLVEDEQLSREEISALKRLLMEVK